MIRYIFILFLLCSTMCNADDDHEAMTPDKAIKKLKKGNERFVNNASKHCDYAE